MSIINKDQELVNKGRKNALQDSETLQVEASLRDQIPQKLLKKLRDMDVGQKVYKMWLTGNANRQTWLERQQEFLADWDEFLPSTDQGAFNGSSNLHLPMPFIVIKTLHARFLQALLGIDPPFTVKARREDAVERSAMVQEVMEYAIKDWANCYEGAYEALDDWVWQWLSTGSGILKQRWDVEYTRFMDVQQVAVPAAPRSEIDENGIEILVPQTKMKEKEVAVTKKKFEGPVFENILNEDFVMIGGKGNPQKADACFHREMLTASQLWTLVDRNVFDEDAVEKVIRGGKDHNAGNVTGAIKYQRAMNAGKSQVDSEVELDRYEILESYLKLDVDDSGINSDIVCWVHPRSGEILRATYLNRINKSGERPFSKIDFHRRAGEDYGIGMVEIMHPLSIEMDAMHNMRIDFGMISSMPFGFYRPTSSINPETINLEPGALIPVDNPQTDVYFPNLGNRTSFGFQEEAALQNMVERLTGISDLSLGLQSSQGAARTATGARAILGEANANLDVHLRRLNLGWKKTLDYLLHMLQQRLPDGFSFRLTGDDGSNYWAYIAQKEDICGDFDFEVSPNTSSSNKSIQVENAQQIMQITSNPLDIQLGVVNPNGRYEAIKNYLSTIGVKDYGKFINKPAIPRIFSPQEEVNRILRGVDTPVTPQSDHEGYMEYYQYLISQPEILSQFSQQDISLLKIQAAKHEQMMQAMEEMAAQQRNVQQMQQNAQTSQNQSSPGLNPMAGAGPTGVSNE